LSRGKWATNLEQPTLRHVQKSDTMASATKDDPTRALQGTNQSGSAMKSLKMT
ncbi:hypothetical protein TNCV_4190761, partial [Trichonephila clavipes]